VTSCTDRIFHGEAGEKTGTMGSIGLLSRQGEAAIAKAYSIRSVLNY
jgi:hypothetical protein